MPSVKPMADIVGKWQRRTAVAGEDYAQGVRNARRPWAAATAAAEGNWAAGVQRASADKRFGKGVNKAGDAKWLRGATEKGAARFAPGVAAAASEFESGYAPIRNAIESVTLRPRGPKGDPGNWERSKQVGMAAMEASRRS